MVDLKSLKSKLNSTLDDLEQTIKSVDSRNKDLLNENIILQKILLKHLNKFKDLKTADDVFIETRKIAEKEYYEFFDKNESIAVIQEKSCGANICQVTKQEIKTPWLSICNHEFEKSSVIDEKGRLRHKKCPVQGCNKDLKEKIVK